MARSLRFAYIPFLALALLIAAPALAQEEQESPPPVGISGAWIMTVESDQGAQDLTVTFKQETEEATEITGVLDGPMGALEMAGEIDAENNISFWASVEAPDGSGYFDIYFVGTVVENKTMSGTMDIGGGMMTADFMATRKEKK